MSDLLLFSWPRDVGDQGSEVLLSVYPPYPGDLILVVDENSNADANESPTSIYSPDLQPKRIKLSVQTLHLDSPQTFLIQHIQERTPDLLKFALTSEFPISVGGNPILLVAWGKNLGITLDSSLSLNGPHPTCQGILLTPKINPEPYHISPHILTG